MALSDRKKKSERLRPFLGEFVNIYLNNSKMVDETNPDQPMVSAVVQGYVIDVDESFMYLGPTPEDYVAAVDLGEIGVIAMSSEEIESMPTPTPDDEVH